MKIVIAGNYGAGNLGDEMILEGILATLKAIEPHAQITVLSGNPVETAKKYNVDSVPKFSAGIRSLIKAIFSRPGTGNAVKDCDYFILGGGGLFGNLTFSANIIWGVQAAMAYYYKKPVLMWGQSIGELKGRLQKWLVRRLFKRAYFISVRDENSKETLKRLGLRKQIFVISDMAFAIENSGGKINRKNTMIVSLRQMPNLDEKFIPAVSVFLNWLIENQKWEVEFAAFQEGKEGDDSLHEKIINNLKNRSGIRILDKKDIPDAFLKSKMVLGMRLHSLITAIKTSTPFIAVSYAPKVENVLKYAKFDDFVIKTEEVTAEKLKSLFSQILGSSEKIIKELEQYTQKTFEQHKRTRDLTIRKILSTVRENRRK
ncbi:MAG: polysaccharide pyruvyl transferase family protein [Candidatus Peregrinibacteria bacterium]